MCPFGGATSSTFPFFTKQKRVHMVMRHAYKKKKKYIYIYGPVAIYIYAVKLLSGPSLAILGVIIWAK